MAELPTGTVTFLFTDIEGSTRLLHELGAEEYAATLAEHRDLMRRAFAEHGGVEVDTQGDAFFVAFKDAPAAVSAALSAQLALSGNLVRVRMGLHTGSPRVSGEGYVGEDVHLGARVAAAGHGGQVLLTKAAVTAAGSADVTDLGEHRVKDFDRPVWIYQVGSGQFPPLKTISNTNLPRPASSFVGRDREIAELAAQLRNGARLLTLTGPGGTGKTRLAIEAATDLVASNRNGVFWVPLAALSDPALVSGEIAQTLGAKNSLAEHIGQREMLLLLDNFEQVVEAAPELPTLLADCPNLRLLVTSRERLRVQGEVEYAVPPLVDREAIELFSLRAGIDADDDVAELCRRLDNLPLAVELAAARAGVLSPAQILQRLAQRLDLLKGGRDTEARQQTLRATIEWSYELLSDEEKALFARLAVFYAGSTLDAAEKVADADLDTLESLVDKSLVRHSGDRFWMLETIREYALERLEALGFADALRRRHAEHFLALAEAAEEPLDTTADVRDEWCDRLERDHENLRAAMDHFEANGDFQSSMRLAGAIIEFWGERAHYAEARRRYNRLIEADATPSIARAKALNGAAQMAELTGNLEAARRWDQEALDIYRASGDERGIAMTMWGLGYNAVEAGDYATAEPILIEVVDRLGRLGNETMVAWATRTLAFCYEELGNHVRSRVLHEQNLVLIRRLGDHVLESATLSALSTFALEDGRLRDSASLMREGLQLTGQIRDRMMTITRLGAAANTLASLGKESTAAVLLGCADAQFEEVGAVEPWAVRFNERTLTLVRAKLEEDALAEMRAKGRELTLEAAVAMGILALDEALESL